MPRPPPVLALWYLYVLCSLNALSAAASYCTSADSCWPAPTVWSAFNSSVGGRIIATRPPAAPCHPLDPAFDNSACTAINSSWTDTFFRASRPGATQDTYWENGNSSCYIDFRLDHPCEQGLVPVMILAAQTVSDVQAGVNFSRAHRLRLRIQSSGHDYVGRSTGEGSFQIWLHKMKGISFFDDFVPSGAPIGTKGVKAVRVHPGDEWVDVYDAANKTGVIIVGPAGAHTVSTAGGYVMGGGFSILSPTHGLAVDNVLQFTVVNADGKVVIANSHLNSDLFWALRDGGGGTFGVVIDAVHKTHPALSNALGVTFSMTAPSPTELSVVFKSLLDIQPALSDLHWYSTAFVSGSTFSVTAVQVNSPLVTNGNMTAAAMGVFAPVLATAAANSVQSSFDANVFPDFISVLNAFFPPAAVGVPAVIGSRLIPRSISENSTSTQMLAEFAVKQSLIVFNLVAGGFVSKVPASATAVNPGWRRALHHVILGSGWTSSTSLADRDIIRRNLTSQVSVLDSFSEGLGCYLNEADADDAKWPESFWGGNYPRLLALKAELDPAGVFECSRCVGSELLGS